MVIKRAQGILSADFPAAKVIFNTATREPYILNSTASEIWDLCSRPRRVETLAKYLRLRYGLDTVSAKKDVACFVSELKRRGLVG